MRWRSGLGITVLLQAISYLGLIAFYLPASGLPSNVTIVDSLDFVENRGAMVAYKDPTDGKTYQIRLDGTGRAALDVRQVWATTQPVDRPRRRYNISADWGDPEDASEWINYGWS